jgi:phage-related minor tail protein
MAIPAGATERMVAPASRSRSDKSTQNSSRMSERMAGDMVAGDMLAGDMMGGIMTKDGRMSQMMAMKTGASARSDMMPDNGMACPMKESGKGRLHVPFGFD